MSLYDYEAYRQLPHMPFASLIMAAYQRADTGNAIALAQAFPEIVAEIGARYNAPGGILPSDPEAVSA